MMQLSERTLRWISFAITLAILVGGWLFWSRDLSADAPLNFSGFSQGLSTDPALYTYHAKNRVLFDKADPLGDPRWVLFEKSFAGFWATVWFKTAGISIAHSRQVGIALAFAGLICMLLALWRRHSPWVAPAVAVALLGNLILAVYGSYPFLETSLLFFSGATFLIYSLWGDRWWGLAFAAVAISAATFSGKIFGVLLLPVLIGCELIQAPKGKRVRRIGIVAGAFAAASAILIASLYGSQLADAIGFIREQSVESHQFPEALTSPWSFVAYLLVYGFRNDLYHECPDLLWFFFLSMVLLWTTVQSESGFFRRLPRTTLFALGWVVMIWIGMALPTYSPPRYSLTYIPAITILCFSMLDVLSTLRPVWPLKLGWRSAAGIAVAVWVVAMQLGLRWFGGANPATEYVSFMLFTLPIALVFMVLVKYLGHLTKWAFTQRVILIIAALSVIGSVGSNIYAYSLVDIGQRTYHISDANNDLQFILGPGAVISGPYAAALTQENKVMSHPHFFGEAWSDSALFVELPITHLAVDESNFKSAVSQSRSLESAPPITTYWIGAHPISIFDISRIYDNPKANAYLPGRYEQAVRLFDAFKFDSALILLGDDPDLINRSRSAALLYARSLFKADLDEEAINNYQVLLNRYPTDFLIAMEAANAMHQVAEVRSDSSLYLYAMGRYRQAILLNPYEQPRVEKLMNDTRAYFDKLREARKSRLPQTK